MTALATANIFRDMSGLSEVSELLKKLSDNSVAIAGVAQKAATGGGGSNSSGGTGTAIGTGSAPGDRISTGTGTALGQGRAPGLPVA